MVPVVLDEIRDSAIRIAIRLALGEFTLKGPRDNILELESRVAWATVTVELDKEGYFMVEPGEYAATCGIDEADVVDLVETDGDLFALTYQSGGHTSTVVPLSEHEGHEHLGPTPG